MIDEPDTTDPATPMTDALDAAAELHELAENTAEETLAEAASRAMARVQGRHCRGWTRSSRASH